MAKKATADEKVVKGRFAGGMTYRPDRLTAIVEDGPMAVCGYRFTKRQHTPGRDNPNGATTVLNGPAERLAGLIEQAEQDFVLTPGQWNILFAECGDSELLDTADRSDQFATFLKTTLEGRHVGRKILEVLTTTDASEPLNPLAVEVVLSALRFRKHHADRINQTAKWWTAAYRKQAVETWKQAEAAEAAAREAEETPE